MNRIRYVFRQSVIILAVILLSGITPAPIAFAEGEAPTGTDATAMPAEAGTGPTGSDSVTYHFNESTGLWENDYYTYNPSTKETVPKVPLEYTYNPDTGLWDTTMWVFSAAQQAYQQAIVSLASPPAGAITHGGPVEEPVVPVENIAVPEQLSSDVSQTGSPEGFGAEEVVSPLPQTNLENTTSATLTNNILSAATSGNSGAISNDDVGGVGTGDAAAIANIVNLLQSQTSFADSGLTTFTTNIQGDVTGDFLIDPASLLQPAGSGSNDLANTTITNQTNGTILNNIDLTATSGNALAEDNDDVGSVTSGNANAVADVINMINSVVAANQSFLGVINIYGDYTGNILMPVDSLNALLASTGTVTDGGSNTSSTVDNDFSANVANNINLTAASGDATATNNDDVGSITSGNGMTNLTILNLTGRQVIAANSLLVFVNVLGTWVGLIMDAPAGTTSAALGGGITGNTTLAGSSNISNAENYNITNNINLAAASGDATAANNDDVGSVTSGDATASANIANLINSSFSLSNWFGILFINVFGAWHGNFGVMKPPVVAPITSGVSGPASGAANPLQNIKVFAFVPKTAASTGAGDNTGTGPFAISAVALEGSDSTYSNDTEHNSGKVLAASTIDSGNKPNAAAQALASGMNYWSIVMFTIAAAGFGIVGVERIRRNLRNHTTVQR